MWTMRRRARGRAREERTPNGCTAQTRRRGSTGNAPNPVRQSARLAETTIARETVARRRRAGPGSLSLSVCVSLLSVDRRDGARSSSSKRSPTCSSAGTSLRAPRRRPPRQHTYKESQCRRSRRLVDDPRAVGPKGPWRRPGAAGRPSKTLRRGCLFREVRQVRSHAATCTATASPGTVHDTPGNRF